MKQASQYKLTCSIENAGKFADWVRTRGGVAVWHSVNLSNPGASWSTPANDKDGKPYEKPTWQAYDAPAFIVTDPADIGVCSDKAVMRFHVAVQRGDGLSFKLTRASSERVRRAVAEAGDGAHHVFDYDFQDAIILKPDRVVSLAEWIEENASKEATVNA